jgi:hypothetical protein
VEPVPYAKLGDPQSLNLYTYVMNNPVTDLDADGHCKDPTGCTPPPAKHPKLANRQAKQQKNTLHYKKGVPPASPKVAKMLRCTQRCAGFTLTVTSTTDEVIRNGRVVAHGPGTPHGKGEAADVREPKGTGGPILFCGAVCGAKFGLDEGRHPSKYASGPHVHLQITPGRYGGRGDLPLPLVDVAPDLGTTTLSPLE